MATDSTTSPIGNCCTCREQKYKQQLKKQPSN